MPPQNLPCAGDPARARSCSDVIDANGVRVVSEMTSDHNVVGRQGQRTSIWSLQAVALCPHGRQVVMTVNLLIEPTDAVPAGESTYDSSAAVTLDQLRAVVADSDLTAVAN